MIVLAQINLAELKAKTAGKSRIEISRICDVPCSSLSRVFAGMHSTIKTAKKISDALGLTKTNYDLKVKRRPCFHVAIFVRDEVLDALKQRNIAVLDAAKLCGISDRTFYSLLNGKKIRRRIALKIDKALGLEKTRYFETGGDKF